MSQMYLPKRLIPHVDVHAKQPFKGWVPLSALERLSNLADQPDEHLLVEAWLTATSDPDRWQLRGTLTGSIKGTCQRCLGPVDWPVSLEISVEILETESAAERYARHCVNDMWILEHVADRPAPFWALVEEEVLLSLPMCMKHTSPCLAR